MSLLKSIQKEYNAHWDNVNKHSVVSGDFNAMLITIKQAAYNGHGSYQYTRETLPIYFNEKASMSEHQKKQCEVRRNILINRFEREGFTVKEVSFDGYYTLTIGWV